MQIYLTTNNTNGKKYVGMATKNDPNYFGSGVLIKEALKKYGKANFSKRILVECESEEEMREAEEFFIEELNAVEDPFFYNLHEGGRGGDTGFHDDTDMSAITKSQWDGYTPEQRTARGKITSEARIRSGCAQGHNNPRARKAEVNGKEYPYLKAALKDLPDVPYSTLKYYAKSGGTNMKYGFTARYL